MNKDIRDKVYINGQWIDDYFLTEEKNTELKKLRTDLELESEIRKNETNDLAKSIKDLDKKSTTLDTEILFELNKEQKARVDADRDLSKQISEEVETRNSQANILENLIEIEKERAIESETNLNSEINTLKIYSNETYETKDGANNSYETLNKKLDDTKDELLEAISAQVTGSNKWLDAVDTVNDLVDPETLDNKFTYLCKVQNETSDEEYTYSRGVYQLIASDNEEERVWTLYSKTEDYVDEKELEKAISKHNTSTDAHKDIRDSISKNATDISALQTAVSAITGTGEDSKDLGTYLQQVDKNKDDIADLQKDTHTHSNKDLLDTYTQTEEDLSDAVSKKHEHDNKDILDATEESFTTELKDKLDNIDLTKYQLINNISQNLNDFTDDELLELGKTQSQLDVEKYPSVAAVKNYIKENKVTIDTNEFVHKDGEPQLVNASTSFSDFRLVKIDEESDGVNDVNIYLDSNVVKIENITIDPQTEDIIHTAIPVNADIILPSNEIRWTNTDENATEPVVTYRFTSDITKLLNEINCVPTVSQVNTLITRNLAAALRSQKDIYECRYIIDELTDEKKANLLNALQTNYFGEAGDYLAWLQAQEVVVLKYPVQHDTIEVTEAHVCVYNAEAETFLPIENDELPALIYTYGYYDVESNGPKNGYALFAINDACISQIYPASGSVSSSSAINSVINGNMQFNNETVNTTTKIFNTSDEDTANNDGFIIKSSIDGRDDFDVSINTLESNMYGSYFAITPGMIGANAVDATEGVSDYKATSTLMMPGVVNIINENRVGNVDTTTYLVFDSAQLLLAQYINIDSNSNANTLRFSDEEGVVLQHEIDDTVNKLTISDRVYYNGDEIATINYVDTMLDSISVGSSGTSIEGATKVCIADKSDIDELFN